MWCAVTVTSFVKTGIIVSVPGLLIFWWRFYLNGALSTILLHGYCRAVLKMPGYGLGSWRNWNSCYVYALFAIQWTPVTVPSSKSRGAWSFRLTSLYCRCLWYVEIYITWSVKAYFRGRVPKQRAGSAVTKYKRSPGIDARIVRRDWREMWNSYKKETSSHPHPPTPKKKGGEEEGGTSQCSGGIFMSLLLVRLLSFLREIWCPWCRHASCNLHEALYRHLVI